jgi:hypothetical protein
MDILAYIDRFITSIKEALQSYDDCDTNNEVPLEYNEEVELMWLVSLAQY